MEKNKNSQKRKKRSSRKADERRMILHGVMVAGVIFIVFFAIYGVIRLKIWDKGKESEYDRNEINHDFDVETEDFLMPLTPQKAELQKEDGVNTILILGNGSYAKSKNDPNSFASLIEKKTGGKVYDATLDKTYLMPEKYPFEEEYPTDIFSLYWICQCISINDFTPLKDYARVWDADPSVTEVVDMLSNLDLSTIDTILIAYDHHDYEDGRILASPLDETIPVSCCGSLQNSIRALYTGCPQVRVIVSSPYFCYVDNEKGELESGETADFGYGPLGDYMIAFKNIAVNNDASFIDNYFGSITVENYDKYLESDSKSRLNKKGLELMADRAAAFIGTS